MKVEPLPWATAGPSSDSSVVGREGRCASLTYGSVHCSSLSLCTVPLSTASPSMILTDTLCLDQQMEI